MSERRVLFRQCDLERAIRAAKATGAGLVMVRPDGTIMIEAEPTDSEGARRGLRHNGLVKPKGVGL